MGSGFPNAAEEAGNEPLNLHKLIVKSPASTFFMRVDSSSYAEMGIYAKDLLVIDRSLEMQSGDMVVAYINGDFVIRQYKDRGNIGYLWAGNADKKPTLLTNGAGTHIWGVVSHVIHDYRGALA